MKIINSHKKPSMDCPEKVKMFDYLDEKALEHAKICPSCNNYLTRLKNMEILLSKADELLKKIEPTDYFHTRKPSPRKIIMLSTAVIFIFALLPLGLVKYNKIMFSTDFSKQFKKPHIEAFSQLPANMEKKLQTKEFHQMKVSVILAQEKETTGRSFNDGISISLEGPGKTEIIETSENELRLKHHDGYLAVLVPPEVAFRRRVSVEASNVLLEVKGTIFASTARGGRIEIVEVEKGAVRVISLDSKSEKIIPAGKMFEEATGKIIPLPVHRISIAQRFFGLRGSDEKSEEIKQPSKNLHIKNETEEEFSENPQIALEIWKKLIAKEGRKPELLYQGAQIMRKLSKFEEAFDLLFETSNTGNGRLQEKSLFLACQIAEEKLADYPKVLQLTNRYRKTYPSGIFLQEILIMEASAHFKLKNYDNALNIIEEYINLFPDGHLITKARITGAKIYITIKKDCTKAKIHLDKILQQMSEGRIFEEAQKLSEKCKDYNK